MPSRAHALTSEAPTQPPFHVDAGLKCFDATELETSVTDLRDGQALPNVPVRVDRSGDGIVVRLYWQDQLRTERLFEAPPPNCDQQALVIAVAVAVALDDTWETLKAEETVVSDAPHGRSANKVDPNASQIEQSEQPPVSGSSNGKKQERTDPAPAEQQPSLNTTQRPEVAEPDRRWTRRLQRQSSARRSKRSTRRSRDRNTQVDSSDERWALRAASNITFLQQPSLVVGGSIGADVQLGRGFRLGLTAAGQGREANQFPLAAARVAVISFDFEGCYVLGWSRKRPVHVPLCLGINQGVSYFRALQIDESNEQWKYWLGFHVDIGLEVRVAKSMAFTARARINVSPITRRYLVTRGSEQLELASSGIWGPELSFGVRFTFPTKKR